MNYTKVIDLDRRSGRAADLRYASGRPVLMVAYEEGVEGYVISLMTLTACNRSTSIVPPETVTMMMSGTTLFIDRACLMILA